MERDMAILEDRLDRHRELFPASGALPESLPWLADTLPGGFNLFKGLFPNLNAVRLAYKAQCGKPRHPAISGLLGTLGPYLRL